MFRCHYCYDWVNGRQHLAHPYHIAAANEHNPVPQGTTQVVREENQRTQDHRLNESRTLSQYHSDAAHPLGSVVGACLRTVNKAKEEEESRTVEALEAGQHAVTQWKKRSSSSMQPVGAAPHSQWKQPTALNEMARRNMFYHEALRNSKKHHSKQPYQRVTGDRRVYGMPRFVRPQPAGLWTSAVEPLATIDEFSGSTVDEDEYIVRNGIPEDEQDITSHPGWAITTEAMWPSAQSPQATDEQDVEDSQRRICEEKQIKVYDLKEKCALAQVDLVRTRREVFTTWETISPQPYSCRKRTSLKLSAGPNARGNSIK
jgi:hypothetical protein